MNPDDLDTAARHAVAALHTDAPSAEETDAALAAVKSGGTTTVPIRARSRRTQPWRAAVVGAALVAAAVAGFVLVPRAGGDSSPGEPVGPVTASSASPPPPTSEESGTTSSVPPSDPPVSQTEVPYALQPRDGITHVTGVALTQPEVLWSATIGSGPGQLGVEECEECDRPRPFSPVVTAGGTVLIVDWVNARVMAVDQGVVTAAPLPEGFLPWATTLGYDGWLYVGGSTGYGQPDAVASLLAYDPSNLAEPVRTALPDGTRFISSTATALPAGVSIDGGATVAVPYQGPEYVAMPAARFVTGDGHTSAVLTAGYSGPLVVEFEPGWEPAGFVQPLTMTGQFAAAMQTPAGELVVTVVYPDGPAVAMPLPRSWSYDGQPFVDGQGIVVLEQTDVGYDVVRYPLPA